MLKKDFLELIKDVAEDGDIDNFISNTDVYKNAVSLDNVKKLLSENKDFKSFMDSEKDKHSQKALETWKSNNLSKIIDEEVAKRGGKQETPEQKQIRELQERLDKADKEKKQADLKLKYSGILSEKKLPSNILDLVLNSDNEEVINSNIALLEEVWQPHIDAAVKEKIGESSHVPPNNNKGSNNTSYDALLKGNPSVEEVQKFFEKNNK